MECNRGWATLALVVAALLLAPGCYTVRFGNHDRTEYVQLPKDIPREQWARGKPIVTVAFEGVLESVGEGEPYPDDNDSFYYSRLLRKAEVFEAVRGPDVAAGDSPVPLARARLELHYEEDDHTSGNFAKAALAPGLAHYRFDLAGTMRFVLTLPDSEQEVTYEATTILSRLYFSSGRRRSGRLMLYREVDKTNFLNIIHQLRTDPRLYRTAHEPPEDHED
jgi:hypothetical protein